MPADPEELGGRETGQGRVGDQPDQRLATAGFRLDLVAFGRRALIVPEQGGADHLAGRIKEDRAVHLAAQADPATSRRLEPARASGPARPSCLVASHQSSGSCSDQPGRGWSHGYSADAEARIVPLLVDGQRLGPGRTDVDSQRDTHGMISQRSPHDRIRGSTPAGSRRASASNASTGTVLKVNMS